MKWRAHKEIPHNKRLQQKKNYNTYDEITTELFDDIYIQMILNIYSKI